MNKKVLIYVITIFLAVTGALYGETMKFGKDLTLKETTTISSILETPENYLNKTVKIEGLIVGVCAHKGCWMSLAGDKEFQKIRVKVKDGDMVFPMTAQGKTAVVEGRLYKIVQDNKAPDATTNHDCAAHGKGAKSDKKNHSCSEHNKADKTGKKQNVVYQFKPTGVVIK